ncbi:aerolysin family beta-barrel pore-forming toxin [Vibrio lentus]|nr:aerolysin family beta-barrel pore-forming toxin [Vibrio lentus]
MACAWRKRQPQSDNFSYTLDSEAFSHGTILEPAQELIKTVSAYAINESNEPKQIIADLQFEQSTRWQQTNRFDLVDSVIIS